MSVVGTNSDDVARNHALSCDFTVICLETLQHFYVDDASREDVYKVITEIVDNG